MVFGLVSVLRFSVTDTTSGNPLVLSTCRLRCSRSFWGAIWPLASFRRVGFCGTSHKSRDLKGLNQIFTILNYSHFHAQLIHCLVLRSLCYHHMQIICITMSRCKTVAAFVFASNLRSHLVQHIHEHDIYLFAKPRVIKKFCKTQTKSLWMIKMLDIARHSILLVQPDIMYLTTLAALV